MNDCEMPSVYARHTPVARREHKCVECGYVIKPGERYYSHRGVWDGRGATYKNCDVCEDLRTDLMSVMPSGFCILFGELYDEWEQMDENNGKSVAEFRAAMQEKREAREAE